MLIGDLVKKCLQGDEESWSKLIDYVSPLIFSICRKNNLSREEAGDVYGQVAYVLLKNLQSIHSVDKLLQYVGRITANEAAYVYRKMKLAEKSVDRVYDTIYQLKPLTPEEIYEFSRKSEAVLNLLMRLSEREYNLLIALFLDTREPKYDEIADMLNIPVSSIGPTRARALLKLKKLIKENNIEL